MNFFLIEIHAYKIGDSDAVPKFEVVEKPNDFVKRSKAKTNDSDLNKSQGSVSHSGNSLIKLSLHAASRLILGKQGRIIGVMLRWEPAMRTSLSIL